MLSGIWGSAYLFIHVVVGEVGAFTVVAGRLTVAAIFLAPLAARSGGVLPSRGSRWPTLFLAIFYNVIPFSLITIAEKSIATGLAATLVATMPLFTLMTATAAGDTLPAEAKVLFEDRTVKTVGGKLAESIEANGVRVYELGTGSRFRPHRGDVDPGAR